MVDQNRRKYKERQKGLQISKSCEVKRDSPQFPKAKKGLLYYPDEDKKDDTPENNRMRNRMT